MAVPYTFGSILGGASIPLSELDDNFSYLTTSPTFTGNITVNGGVDSFGTSSYFGGSAPLVYTGIGIRNTAPNGYSSINWLIGPAGANGIAGIYYAPGIFLRMTVDANDTTTPITFNNNNNQERMRIDASGNVGIGTIPSAWGGGNKAIQQPGGSIASASSSGTYFTQNAYFDGSNWKYVATNTASYYAQVLGAHQWHVAASGTAGNNIIFTQAMTLDASGNLNTYGSITANANVSGQGCYISRNGADGGGIVGTVANASLSFHTNNTERARIDGSGNLGVGTTSPSSKLHASSPSSFVQITAEYNGSGAAGINFKNGGSSTGYIYYDNGANMLLHTANSERVRIDSSGNVVINTAAIATNATDGFLYVPTCAGTPTGTPTAYAGRSPIVVDTTNNKLYFYSGGAWRDAGP